MKSICLRTGIEHSSAHKEFFCTCCPCTLTQRRATSTYQGKIMALALPGMWTPFMQGLCMRVCLRWKYLQEHLQYHTSEELFYFRVQIVLLWAKRSLSYLWMRALWHLATGLIEHRCELYSIWRRSKGGDPRLVSDLQGVRMQLFGIELPR